ncbi:MAG: hypothetical protein JSV19_11670 [Phycisphaerales bacterium]|nr:MAG: hypothetical protein JSV19_11670 [Phycisphaerales bacterium]
MTQTARLIVCLAVPILVAGTAEAGVFRDTVRGLRLAGFDFSGEKNPVSGGADFQLGRTFNNDTLDFGGTELTLTGPIVLTFSTGGRVVPVLDVSVSTAGQPFSYLLDADVGGQSVLIDGNFLLDATGSMNTFGWYDFQLEYSVRETISQDGRFSDEEEFVEFDIGPIDVSGNIFADFLAVLFDPIFQGTGTDNIFASFSGRLQAQEELNRRLADARAEALGFSEFATMSASQMLEEIEAGAPDWAGQFTASSPAPGHGVVSPSVVPDPPTLLLLLAGLPLLRASRRRHG